MDEEYIEFIPTFADLVHEDPRFEFKVRVLSWEEGNQLLPRARGGCWEWTGYVNWSGANKTIPYGRIRRPKAGAKASAPYVHVYVWEIFFGKYSEGHETHHDCQNTICINPSHYGPIDPDEHDLIHLGQVRNLGRWARKGRK